MVSAATAETNYTLRRSAVPLHRVLLARTHVDCAGRASAPTTGTALRRRRAISIGALVVLPSGGVNLRIGHLPRSTVRCGPGRALLKRPAASALTVSSRAWALARAPVVDSTGASVRNVGPG